MELNKSSMLHDHCYTNYLFCNTLEPNIVNSSLAEGRAVVDKSRFPKENDPSNPLINGISEAYTNPRGHEHSTPNIYAPNAESHRAVSLLDNHLNGYRNNVKFVSGKQPNKIHELLFGDEESKYVGGVHISQPQTVSDDSNSISTSDFGYYINNPTSYNSLSPIEARTVTSSSADRKSLFGCSMSVDSETEILEAASALMELARNYQLNTKRTQLKNKKLKKDKNKTKSSKLLKVKADLKPQKRKYTKRNKLGKRETVKPTYSLWSNGHKYDEFEYYATKPVQRSSNATISRKSSVKSHSDTHIYEFDGQDSREASTSNKISEDSETKMALCGERRKRRYSQRLENFHAGPEPMDTVKTEVSLLPRKLALSPQKDKITAESAALPSTSQKSPQRKVVKKFQTSPARSESSVGSKTPDKDALHSEKSDSDLEDPEESLSPQPVKRSESTETTNTSLRKYFNKNRRKSKEYASDDDDGSDVEYKPITFVRPTQVATSDNVLGQTIPTEILLKIFRIIVEEEGVAPFLARASQVCRLWYTVAADKSLWQKVNLSGNVVKKFKKNFRWLTKYRLPPVRILNLANWEVLTYKEVELLGKHCPNIESINLSRCSRVTPSSLKTLFDTEMNLKHVDLSFATTFIASRFVLEHLVDTRGHQLENLNCSYNILVKFDVVLDTIMNKCPNLQVLDLSNAIFSSCLLPIRIEKLQEGCPRLKKLILANSLFKVKSEELLGSPGFTELEILNVARSTVSHLSKFKYVNDQVLHSHIMLGSQGIQLRFISKWMLLNEQFLRGSTNLKSLDVSGCRHITNTGLQNLAIPNLETLSLSYCRASAQPEIKNTILRWSHSLTTLDFSGNSVDPDLIRAILTHCESLTSLNLSACRGLPWDKRREFSGVELTQLRNTLEEWI